MKTITFMITCFLAAIAGTSCNNANGAMDLETGEAITVAKDSVTGEAINAETGKPVMLYVDKRTKDTIYGPTGEVANGKVKMTGEGKYVYYGEVKADDDAYKIKGEDYKEKYEDGDYKLKQGDYKKKVDKDGDVKIKTGDRTIKIDGETGERKVK